MKNYDYSQNGCYFVTVCVKDRKNLLGMIPVGRDAYIPPGISPSNIGTIADKYIQNINSVYWGITVDHYVIMPNHVHLLITIEAADDGTGGMRASRPTLHTVVRSFKTMVTREIGYSVWQSSYYERVIRNESGYREAWEYIDVNPMKWTEDELYC
ncbi:MAG TPA: transposase [Clostridia bacterium]|nr:transposase [Clostridia bacterium]